MSAPTYPDRLPIQPVDFPLAGTVEVPGSKSITNRALILAALSGEKVILERPLDSEDTHVMVGALRTLGVMVEQGETEWTVHRPKGASFLPVDHADLFVANSGTSMRFLTAFVSLARGRFRLDGIPRMRERPIQDLLDALRQLAVDAVSETGNGCPPVIIDANGLGGGTVRIRGDVSSQFLSALLMAAPLAREDVTIEVEGDLVSLPYVTMTIEMMRHFGANVETPAPNVFLIPSGAGYHPPGRYLIEPDASAASYFLAAAAITGGTVRVRGLNRSSLQGDVHFADCLARMGCNVNDVSLPDSEGLALEVQAGPLRGIDVDMNAISDTVMTLAAVACFADGPTTIRNVAHIRHKETDRIAALATELRRLGARVAEHADGLTIHPGSLHGAEVDTYNDHRMAMSLALIGLKVDGVVINNPGCVAKTYPGFFDDLGRLREGSPGTAVSH